MSALLSPPASFPRLHRAPVRPEPQTSAAQVTQLLCGSGLLMYGLLRGSWLGLTFAAAGGFLLYRGLTSAPVMRANRCPFTPQDDSPAGQSQWPSVVLPSVELGQDLETATVSPAMQRSEELTAEEHAEARVAAYYHALHRGGGWLPPYEHAKAVEDFCRAAETILRQRCGG